jgi:hypothetical protein
MHAIKYQALRAARLPDCVIIFVLGIVCERRPPPEHTGSQYMYARPETIITKCKSPRKRDIMQACMNNDSW